jgi:hypothetical protein
VAARGVRAAQEAREADYRFRRRRTRTTTQPNTRAPRTRNSGSCHFLILVLWSESGANLVLGEQLRRQTMTAFGTA